ncbi:hypothetical protein Cgig2_014688 [Carnegiea gigantea]|uniref:K-box domain-containing protein n=1 Tax=Carnegiea gigantea TaxID=171969 RepID=A0A9Q1QUP0_9CARY|nr:hypothetical protein Cgig2_014688 [Carnegiea gigantea]
MEAANLRQQVDYLQERHRRPEAYRNVFLLNQSFPFNDCRRLTAQELSGLSFKEVRNLENQLETSLKNVRMKKDQILSDEIRELSRRGDLIHQENIELHKQFDHMQQENADLKKKVYGQKGVNQTAQCQHMSNNVKSGNHMNAPIDLQLSPPEQHSNETSMSMKKLKLG